LGVDEPPPRPLGVIRPPPKTQTFFFCFVFWSVGDGRPLLLFFLGF
jgi:hypothetical protein